MTPETMFVFQVNNFHSRKIFCVSYFFHVAKQQLRNNEITFEICLFFQSHFIYAGNTLGSSNRTIRISGKWMTIKYISHNTILIFCTEAQSLNHPNSTFIFVAHFHSPKLWTRPLLLFRPPGQNIIKATTAAFAVRKWSHVFNKLQTNSFIITIIFHTFRFVKLIFLLDSLVVCVYTLNLWKWET